LADPFITWGPPLKASEVLAELGPVLTGERDLAQTASAALEVVKAAARATSAALFRVNDNPAMLSSIAADGFVIFPQTAVIPLHPKHVHALTQAAGPQRISKESFETFLSSTGNISGVWCRCLAPLKVRGKLIGALLLGEREGGAEYTEEILAQLGDLAPFIALGVYNHHLILSLEERSAENLKLIASLHSFADDALAAFAATIDVKSVQTHGHSLRVGRYAAGLAQVLGMSDAQVREIRAAGYLHDIGKVTVDARLFLKVTLEPNELKEMADHTVNGHRIVSSVPFPWPHIPEAVRSHHERLDGSGYPDRLRQDEVSMPVKIIAAADMLDAMLSDRPYRRRLPLGETAAELSWLAPSKLDPDVIHAMLVQLRRDATLLMTPPRPWTQGEPVRVPFLDSGVACNISPADIDHLVSDLNHRVHRGRATLS
jgi:putative nucleotidyltransferase with HDIG domain